MDDDVPIVLLHGWGGSFRSTFGARWEARLARERRRVIGLDLPGHADAAASVDPSTYGDLAALVGKRLPVARFDMIGFSLGAKIALELALRAPERVRRLVLGGVGDNAFSVEASAEGIARALEHGVDEGTSMHARAMVAYSQQSGSRPEALAAILRRPPNPVFLRSRLLGLSVPTLIVNGDADTVALPDAALVSSAGSIEVIRLREIGHVDLPSNQGFLDAAAMFLTRGSNNSVATD